MFQSILLVLAVIMLTMSYVYDKSVKELIENPPTEVMELFQDGSDTFTEGVADGMTTTEEVVGDTKSRIEQATEEAQ